MENNKNKIQKIRVSEVFSTIQGEGRYAGIPMLFIRLYGCTRRCWFCDTLYAVEGGNYTEMSVRGIVDMIKKSGLKCICWTGGEPLLQRAGIFDIIKELRLEGSYFHSLESNGDLAQPADRGLFNYLGLSPKEKKIAKKVKRIYKKFPESAYDIKVVTDLEKEGVDMLEDATMLMPLTTNTKRDQKIQQKVWDYCIKNNLIFTPRYQFWVWGNKKGK